MIKNDKNENPKIIEKLFSLSDKLPWISVCVLKKTGIIMIVATELYNNKYLNILDFIFSKLTIVVINEITIIKHCKSKSKNAFE